MLLKSFVFGPKQTQYDFIAVCDPENGPEPARSWILGFLGDPRPTEIPSQLGWAMEPRGFGGFGRHTEYARYNSDAHRTVLLSLGLKVCVMYGNRKKRHSVLKRVRTRVLGETTYTTIAPPPVWMAELLEQGNIYLRELDATYPVMRLQRVWRRAKYQKKYLCLTRNGLAKHWIDWIKPRVAAPIVAYKALACYLFESLCSRLTLDQLDACSDRMIMLGQAW
jgi:hypothetical protein